MGDPPSNTPPELPANVPILDYRRHAPPLERLPLHERPTFSARDRRQGCLAVSILVAIIMVAGVVMMDRAYGPAGRHTRIQCAINLRVIGQGCMLYANDYGGSYPQRIEQLLWMDLGARYFVCPGSDDSNATGATIDATAADMANPGRCSYIYLAAGLTTATPGNTPIACDRPENHDGKGIHVLYADGTTTWLDKKQAQAFLARLPPTAQHPTTAPADP